MPQSAPHKNLLHLKILLYTKSNIFEGFVWNEVETGDNDDLVEQAGGVVFPAQEEAVSKGGQVVQRLGK